MKAKKIIPFSLIFIFLLALANVNAEEKEEGFVWIISNNKLVKLSEHIILDDSFYIFHTYDYISIKYYSGNETFFERDRQVFQSYLSPVLTIPKPSLSLTKTAFQSYLSPVLTTANRD